MTVECLTFAAESLTLAKLINEELHKRMMAAATNGSVTIEEFDKVLYDKMRAHVNTNNWLFNGTSMKLMVKYLEETIEELC